MLLTKIDPPRAKFLADFRKFFRGGFLRLFPRCDRHAVAAVANCQAKMTVVWWMIAGEASGQNLSPDRVFGPDLAGFGRIVAGWIPGGTQPYRDRGCSTGAGRSPPGWHAVAMSGSLRVPMKFTCRMKPGSPGLADLRVTLRLAGCPHCQRIDTLVGHEFPGGLSPEGSDRVIRGCHPRLALMVFEPRLGPRLRVHLPVPPG